MKNTQVTYYFMLKDWMLSLKDREWNKPRDHQAGGRGQQGSQKVVQETWMGNGYVHYVDCDYSFMATCILISKIIQKYTLDMLTAFSYTSIKLLKQKTLLRWSMFKDGIGWCSNLR